MTNDITVPKGKYTVTQLSKLLGISRFAVNKRLNLSKGHDNYIKGVKFGDRWEITFKKDTVIGVKV